jgi:hypothetical protein
MKQISIVFAAAFALSFACGVGVSRTDPLQSSEGGPTAVDLPGAVGDSPNAAGQACDTIVFGGDMRRCIPEMEVKLMAQSTCEFKKARVGKISLGSACEGGVSWFQAECCGAQPTPPPQPPPDAPRCETVQVGDEKTCLPDAEIKAIVERTCASRDLEVRGVSFGGQCKGGISSLKVECCSRAQPPPPGPRCEVERVGNGMACIPEPEIKTLAERTCAAKNLQPRQISLGGMCKGGVTEFKVECCDKGNPPPPPPPGPRCEVERVGNGMACIPEVEIKALAERTCAAKKLQPRQISLGGMCKGGVTEFKVECCDNANPPPPPPGPRCESVPLGDGKACIKGDLKELALRACAQRNATLRDVAVGAQCEGGFIAAKALCCTEGRPDEPPCGGDPKPPEQPKDPRTP